MKHRVLPQEIDPLNRRAYNQVKDVVVEIGKPTLRALCFPIAVSLFFALMFLIDSKESQKNFAYFYWNFSKFAIVLSPPWLVIRFLFALISEIFK